MHVANNTDDFRGIFEALDTNSLADGIGIGRQALRQAVADDGNVRHVSIVPVNKEATLQKRNLHSTEIAGGHGVPLSHNALILRLCFSFERNRAGSSPSAQRQESHGPCGFYTRKRTDAFQDVVAECNLLIVRLVFVVRK
jgi:hypothetical protein